MLIPSALPASPAPADNVTKISRSAKEFEALLLTEILKSAREGKDDDSAENSTMVELGEQQFAQALANSGGLGIAKMVEAGLTKHADR